MIILKQWKRILSVLLIMVISICSFSINRQKEENTYAASENKAANLANMQWSFKDFTSDSVYTDDVHTVLNSEKVSVHGFAENEWVKDYLQTQGLVVDQFTIGTKLSKTEKGKNSAYIVYHNIGIFEKDYKQENVDMKVTLNDWVVAKGSNMDKAFVLFSTCVPDSKENDHFPHDQSAIGVWLSDNVQSVDLTYTFYKAGTSEEIEVKGNFTQVDLDYLQYFAYEKATSNVKGVYKSEDDEKVWNDGKTPHVVINEDSPSAGWITVQSSSKGLNVDNEETYRAGYVSCEFESSRLSFQFGTKAPLNTSGELKNYYFGVLPYSIASYKEPIPQKFVSDSKESQPYTNEIYKLDGSRDVSFLVNVFVPRSLSVNYNSFSFKDTLNIVLDGTNAEMKVYRDAQSQLEKRSIDNSRDVTSWFHIEKSGQNITVTAKDSTVKEQNGIEFFGHSYHLEIRTKIKDTINLDNYISEEHTTKTIQKMGNYYAIENMAYCETGVYNSESGAFEKKQSKSNIAMVYYSKPALYISKKTDKQYYNIGDNIQYEIMAMQVSKDTIAKEVFIQDLSLPNFIQIIPESVKAVCYSGASETFLSVSVKDNKIITDKMDLEYGDKIVLKFMAMAKEESRESGVTNIAEAVGKDVEPVRAQTTIIVRKPKLEIEKRVISNPKNNLAFQIGDKVKYQVKVENPVKNSYVENLIIEDTWENGMDLQEESVKVYWLESGADFSETETKDLVANNNYDLVLSSNGYKILFKEAMESFWGESTILVEYETTIRLVPVDNTNVNTVFAQGSNVEKVSDQETIIVGEAPSLKLEKEISTYETCVGDEITYTVTAENMGYYDVNDFRLKDESLPVGFVLKSLKVFWGEEQNGNFVWKQMNQEEKGISWSTGLRDWNVIIDSSKGYPLKSREGIQVQAVYTTTNEVDTRKEIVNTAEVWGTASEGTKLHESAEAVVYVEMPELVIKKTSDQDCYGVGEYGIYTLEVSQSISSENQSLMVRDVHISDELLEQAGVTFHKINSVCKIDGEGNEKVLSEEDFQVSLTSQTFEIRTKESLTFGEKLIVQYEVYFEHPTTTVVKNIAKGKGSNTKLVSTEHTVNIKSPKLIITKTSDKKYYNYSETANYTVVVTQTEKAFANNILIKDSFGLDSSFVKSYLKNIKVYNNENEILDKTKYTCVKTEDGYEIQLKEPLGYNQSCIIAYSFEMYAPYEEYGDIVNTVIASSSNAQTVEATCTVACYLCQLSIDKRTTKDKWIEGEQVEYVVEVKNLQSKTDAVHVHVEDFSLPYSLDLDPNSVQAEILDNEGHSIGIEGIEIDVRDDENSWQVDKDILSYGYTLRISFLAEATEEAVGQTIANRAYASADNALEDVMDMAVVQVMERKDYKTTVEVTKKIKASDIYFGHGTPTFIMSLQGTDIFGQKHGYNKVVQFTEENVKTYSDQDGYVSLTARFEDLPMGAYEVTEKETLRYRLKSIEDISNGQTQGEKFLIDCSDIKEDMIAKATFINEKYEWQQCSHNSLIVNQF